MSRQEVAEAVNAHVYFATGRVSAMDAHYVGRLERGIRRYPTADYRAAFRAVLGAATDAELGFIPTWWQLYPGAFTPPSTTAATVTTPVGHEGTAMQLIVTPGMAVVVLPADHPVLLALVDGQRGYA